MNNEFLKYLNTLVHAAWDVRPPLWIELGEWIDHGDEARAAMQMFEVIASEFARVYSTFKRNNS